MNNSWTAKKSLLGITLAGLMVLAGACSRDRIETSNQQPLTSPSASEVADSSGELVAARIGEVAPNFTGVDSNGKSQRLSNYKGKVVVLEWTNDQCPFVRKHYGSGNMQQLQKEATSKGVVWLSVVSSAPGNQGHVTANQANELTKSRNAAPTAVLLDANGTIGKLYKARTTPHMYVIGQDGTMKYMGAIDSTPSSNPADVKKAQNYVRAALDDVLNGRQVKTATTQPYGCTVKYAS